MEKIDLRIKEYMGEFSVQKEIVEELIDETNERIKVYSWGNIDNKVFSDLKTAKMWAMRFVKAKVHYHKL